MTALFKDHQGGTVDRILPRYVLHARDEFDTIDTDVIVDKILGRMTSEEREAVLSEVIRDAVRRILHSPAAQFDYEDDGPALTLADKHTPRVGPNKLLNRAALRRGVSVPLGNGRFEDYMIGDLGVPDIDAIIAYRRDQAAALTTVADKWAALRDLMIAAKAEKVHDLPNAAKVVEETLGGSS